MKSPVTKFKYEVSLKRESLYCISANNYLFNLNNRNTRKRCKICSKLTIKNHFNDVVLVFYC